ncbi:MAG: hypothetical protein R6X20_05440 [Phycisphaerae bacterium]
MASESTPVTVLRRDKPRTVRWIVPLSMLAAIFLVATGVRFLATPEQPTDFKESSPVEIAQAVLHALACLLCVAAMVRSGRRQADFYWWVAPAFITFFMFWREAEIDSDLLGLGENAFTWKYLFEGHMPIWKRLVLGIPSTALAITTLVVCLRHLPLLVETAKKPHVRVTLALFALGIGLYALAQVYDKAAYLQEEYGWDLCGVRAYRDDFWEETMELAGAAAILMSVLDAFRHRPIIPGPVAKAEAEPLVEP